MLNTGGALRESTAPPDLLPMPLRIAIADDSYLVREGLSHVLAGCPELEVITVCDDSYSLLEAIERDQPDVVLTDIRMPPFREREGIRIAAQLPRQPSRNRCRNPEPIRRSQPSRSSCSNRDPKAAPTCSRSASEPAPNSWRRSKRSRTVAR